MPLRYREQMSRVVRKPVFAYAKTKTQISLAVTAKLIIAFAFAIQIVQSLYYLHPKFQASSHLLWLYRSVCVGPGRKPRRPVFSQRGSDDCMEQLKIIKHYPFYCYNCKADSPFYYMYCVNPWTLSYYTGCSTNGSKRLSNVPRSEKNRSSGFPTRSDTNRAVQPQKMARGLKFRM